MTDEIARLVWRCRRGTRELDLILHTYLKQAYPAAPAAERAAFEQLLDLPDPELTSLLCGQAELQDPRWIPLVLRIRALTTV